MISAADLRIEHLKQQELYRRQQGPIMAARAAQAAQQAARLREVEETLLPGALRKLEDAVQDFIHGDASPWSEVTCSIGRDEEGELLFTLLIPLLKQLGYAVAGSRTLCDGTPGTLDGTPGLSAYEEYTISIKW